jgi:hypothetical protein
MRQAIGRPPPSGDVDWACRDSAHCHLCRGGGRAAEERQGTAINDEDSAGCHFDKSGGGSPISGQGDSNLLLSNSEPNAIFATQLISRHGKGVRRRRNISTS